MGLSAASVCFTCLSSLGRAILYMAIRGKRKVVENPVRSHGFPSHWVQKRWPGSELEDGGNYLNHDFSASSRLGVSSFMNIWRF